MRDSPMNHYSTNVACAVLALAGTGLAHAGTTAPLRWTMDTLEQGDNLKVVINDLNNHGQATGYITSMNWTTRPFIRLDSNITLFSGVTSGRGTKINDDGVACGYGLTDLVFRFDESGPEAIASVDNISSTYSNFEVNESGMICGSTNSGSNAFMWSPGGTTELFNDFRIYDMNESGTVAGRSEDTAFLRRNGVLELLDADIALSVDDSDRVMVRNRHGLNDFEFTRYDADSGENEAVAYIQLPEDHQGWNSPSFAANDSGMAAFGWPVENPEQQFNKARMGFWTNETGLVEIEIPDEIHFVLFDRLTDSGMVVGRALRGENYENVAFFASAEHGFVDLSDRMIGADESMHFHAVVDINESGQIALTIHGDVANAHYSVILSPARAGDVDGDDAVGVNDLLQVIANWGVWPAGSPCGPDLNLDGMVDVTDLLTCIGDWD